MRITPLDIYQREFSKKKLGGLDENEVHEFLKKVGREYENLYAENKALKEQSERLTGQMKDYLELEKTLKQTLISAQKASGDLKNNAEREAELIIREAELQAERILDESRSEIEVISREIRELKKQRRMLKVELKTVLESYLAMLNEEPPMMGRLARVAPNEIAA
jgi:cell division initiation protein